MGLPVNWMSMSIIGLYNNDYDNTPNYKWMRQAIQINQRVFNEWKEKQNEAENKPQE